MTPQKIIDLLSTHGPITVVCTWPTNGQQHARVDVLNGADRWTVQGFRDFSTEGNYADKYTLEQLKPIWHTILVDFDTMTGHDARRWIDMYWVATDAWTICDLAHILRNNPEFAAQARDRIEWSLNAWKNKTIRMVNWPH